MRIFLCVGFFSVGGKTLISTRDIIMREIIISISKTSIIRDMKSSSVLCSVLCVVFLIVYGVILYFFKRSGQRVAAMQIKSRVGGLNVSV